jgi:hypothetical protein
VRAFQVSEDEQMAARHPLCGGTGGAATWRTGEEEILVVVRVIQLVVQQVLVCTRSRVEICSFLSACCIREATCC